MVCDLTAGQATDRGRRGWASSNDENTQCGARIQPPTACRASSTPQIRDRHGGSAQSCRRRSASASLFGIKRGCRERREGIRSMAPGRRTGGNQSCQWCRGKGHWNSNDRAAHETDERCPRGVHARVGGHHGRERERICSWMGWRCRLPLWWQPPVLALFLFFMVCLFATYPQVVNSPCPIGCWA